MQKGDIYTKYVRGSRYAFNREGIFYKYPNGQKSYCQNVDDSLLQDMIDAKGRGSGRLIINEIGEMVVYRKREEEEAWEPRYVGKLEEEMEFDGMKINPKDLNPGLLWSGFCSHHGGRFSIDRNKKPFFEETTIREHSEDSKRYFIKDFDEEILKRIIFIKSTGNGRFRVNEYGHVWSPIKRENLEYQMKNDDFKEAFNNQFSNFSSKIKRTIKQYERNINHYPIYMGKVNEELKIEREEKPHIIYDREDEIEFDYNDVDLDYYD